MASWPGPRLEDYVRDAYVFETEKEYLAQIAEMEPAREYIEELVLGRFDEYEMSWRDYRNASHEYVEDHLRRLKQKG